MPKTRATHGRRPRCTNPRAKRRKIKRYSGRMPDIAWPSQGQPKMVGKSKDASYCLSKSGPTQGSKITKTRRDLRGHPSRSPASHPHNDQSSSNELSTAPQRSTAPPLTFFKYIMSLIQNQIACTCILHHHVALPRIPIFSKESSDPTLQFCTQMSTQIGFPTSPMSSKPECKLQTIYTITLSNCAKLAMNTGCCFQLRILSEVSCGTPHPCDFL